MRSHNLSFNDFSGNKKLIYRRKFGTNGFMSPETYLQLKLTDKKQNYLTLGNNIKISKFPINGRY